MIYQFHHTGRREAAVPSPFLEQWRHSDFSAAAGTDPHFEHRTSNA